MTCIGDEALDVPEGFPLSTEDRLDLSKIINAMETFCIGERNEVFESYTFHKRNQKLGESIDACFTELKQIARKCDFQDEDRMIRDRLVIGIAEDQTRKKLLEKKKLSLGEALDICRAQEQATTHAKEMSSTENRVDRMQSGFKRKTPKRDDRVFTGSPVTSTRSTRCGKIRMAGKCPAKLATWYNCNKRGHFAQIYRNKLEKAKVNTLNISESYEDAFLGTVTSTIESPWKAMISLNGKRVVFKIDTEADVSNIDDVLVSGKNQKEHDERLMKVLETLQKAGITLNEKCMFLVGKVKFLGHIISKNGVEEDPSKVESITQLYQPQNVSDVRRLLGMVNQVGKFIDNLATKTEPLRQLLKRRMHGSGHPVMKSHFKT